MTRRFGGTGLGLSIAKEFVELHGGTIVVGDAPEGGADFTVRLPLRAPGGAEVSVPHAGNETNRLAACQALEELRSQVEAYPNTVDGERPLVLVVEDNVEMNRFICEVLGAEFRVANAFDGQDGAERAEQLRPDLIVSDLMMPRFSGEQLVARIRSQRPLDSVPILMLTAKADDEIRARLLRSGAQDYVMKPFSSEELRARAGNLVTMKRARDVLQRELATQLQDLEGLASEVTFRKRELEAALEVMRVARDEAERASQIKSDFMRLVSHELRTPLTSIIGFLQLLERESGTQLSEDQVGIVRRISGSSQRLMDLIESLLEYMRIQSGRLVVDASPVDAVEVARAVAEELRPIAERQGLKLDLQLPHQLPILCSDERLVRLILINLVGNAVKFTRKGFVEFAVHYREGAHCFTVRDSGPGIPADSQAIIFEPFEQLEPIDRKHAPGLGLGLALVRQMVEALGGRLELESQVGTGSTFTVAIPSADMTIVAT